MILCETKEVVYFSWIKCEDCGMVIETKHCQTEKPSERQCFICTSSKCQQQKQVQNYLQLNTIHDVREQKIWLQNTPYAGMLVQSIVTGMITIGKTKKKQQRKKEPK